MPLPSSLSSRQLAIVQALRELITEHGYSPTVREIGQRVGLKSTSSVKHQLDVLLEAGIVTYDPRRSRTLEITELGMRLDTTTGTFSDSTSDHQLSSAHTTIETSNTTPPTTIFPHETTLDPVRSATVTVPLVGRIAAGTPILAEQYVEDTFALPGN